MKNNVENHKESNSQFEDASVISPTEQSQGVKSVVFIKTPKSRAEINRDYRNKQKDTWEELSAPKPKYKKSKAEINKDYSNRLKAKHAEISPTVPKVKKTKAEINRHYRKRLKAKHIQVSQKPPDGELKAKKLTKTHDEISKCRSHSKQNRIPKNISNAERCRRYRNRLKLQKQCLELDTLLYQEVDSTRITDTYNGLESEVIEKTDTCVDALNTQSLEHDPLALEEDHSQIIKIEYNHIKDGTSENLNDTYIDMLADFTQPSRQLEYQDSDDIDLLNTQRLEADPLALEPLEEDVSQTIEIEENYIEDGCIKKLTADTHIDYVTLQSQQSVHKKIIPKNISNSDKCKRYRAKLKLRKQGLDADPDPLALEEDVTYRMKVENNDVLNETVEQLIDPQQVNPQRITVALNDEEIGTPQLTGTRVNLLNAQCFELDSLALEEPPQIIKIEYNNETTEVTEETLPSMQLNFCNQSPYNAVTESVIPGKRKVPKTIFDRQEEFREAKMKKKQSESETENCNNVQRIKIEDSPEIEILDEKINKKANMDIPYLNYYNHSGSHLDFNNDFKNNTYGHSCAVCDRLWWEKDLKMTSQEHENLLQTILPNYVRGTMVPVCFTCKVSLDKQKIPVLSTYNGFSYPPIPSHLPALNLIEQRLISPKIPFLQIRRLRHVNGEDGIYGQVFNIPVEVNTMVQQLPRKFCDDHCFYVHVGNGFIYKTDYASVRRLVNRRKIREWLTYLVQTPLYVDHGIKINSALVDRGEVAFQRTAHEISEHTPVEDSLAAQQQTLFWNEDRFLEVVPSRKRSPFTLLFDKYAEELSFPTIYGGQFRAYKQGLNVTSFMQVCSELRRTDRRGVDPQHLFYMAGKIMRQRISQSVNIASKYCVGYDAKFTRQNVQSAGYINNCIETNFAFLRCVPDSTWYWSDCKKVLFAMIRQLGAPTAFMSLSANETGWTDLLKILYRLKENGAEVSDEFLSEMSRMERAKLVNDDAVTCAIYFNKLVNCLVKILHFKRRSPFGRYRVVDYFKRIEFHRGSPIAHIFLWLDNAPKDLLNNGDDVVRLIDELISVSESEASGNIELQIHKHSAACYRSADSKKKKKKKNCRFGAPFMPSRKTVTLIPMTSWDSDFSAETLRDCREHYKAIRTNLEQCDYADLSEFYSRNNIVSDEHYRRILRAGISRPTLFYRRTPAEKWHNTFNPFVLHHLKSSMSFQIIQDEHACAAYAARYANKLNRGISDLQRRIIRIMDEHPKFHTAYVTKKVSYDMQHYAKMSAQEAAWYLLREPVTKTSVAIAYIPTMRQAERDTVRRILCEINALDEECTDTWKANWFYEYEKRPEELSDLTLAQFVAKYYANKKGGYSEREIPKVISYRNYDANGEFDDYRREMVLLHVPFRSEASVVAEDRYIRIYESNEDFILERRKEFESNFETEKILQICKQLSKDYEGDSEDDELDGEAVSVQNYSSLPPRIRSCTVSYSI